MDGPLKFFLDLFGKVVVGDLGKNHIHKHNLGHDRNQVDDPPSIAPVRRESILLQVTPIIQDADCSSR